jgi:multiple sugar transport system ATP-binding protein
VVSDDRQGLRLDQINHHYGKVHAVADLSLDIPAGSFVTLLGPSGCGKSTTLALVAGLERPTSGRVWLDDRDITDDPPNERGMAMVFQNYALYPHQTVFANIAFGLKLRRLERSDIRARVENAARVLDIEHLLGRKPSELSGGQQQRVALGRALVKEPTVFLLDEPFSNLDATLRSRMRTEVKHLHLRLDTTSVLVTHDQEEAMAMSDFIAVMRDGRLVQFGTQHEIYRKPATTYVATFVGKPRMSLVGGRLEAAGDRWSFIGESGLLKVDVGPQQTVRAPGGAGVDAVFGVRAENLAIRAESTPSATSFEAVVDLIEPIGADTYVELRCGQSKLTARTTPDHSLALGQQVQVEVAGPVHLFDAKTTERLN